MSLMVSKNNHAIDLYRKCGFQEYAEKGDSLLMIRSQAREEFARLKELCEQDD